MTFMRAFFPLAAAVSIAAHGAADSPLERSLARLSRVAELYRDSALGFACQETITYSSSGGGRIQFAYLFIRDEDGRLRDFRTWSTGTTAKDRGQEVYPRDYNVPRYVESAYLWAFVFRSDRQPLYRFDVRPEEIVGGRTALPIEFRPRKPILKGLNDWAGTAWIDRETTQILKVEAYSPADWNRLVDRDAIVANAPRRDDHEELNIYDIERIVTEFGFEKNGMRFPSHVEITKTRSTVFPGAKHSSFREVTLRTVNQDYSRFQFFSVRSREEILRFVNGEAPLRAIP